MTTSNRADSRLTREALAMAIEDLLRAADRLGLAEVGIKLNEAVLALGREGVAPPSRERWTVQMLELLFGSDSIPTWH